jgi:xanthine dehydrogenase molybdopterin-binding subunit B
VFHSKAVGEPPFMLGIAAWCAIKDAVASLGDAISRHRRAGDPGAGAVGL